MVPGHDSTTGHGESSTSTSGSTGESSASSEGSTGAPFCEHDGPVCMCGGEVVDPSECGCFDDPIGWCTCPDGSIEEPCYYPPTNPCHVADDGSCSCDGVPAPPAECGCFWDASGICHCNEIEYPAEVCLPTVCEVELLGGAVQCVCDNAPADPADCGCVWTGMCFCDGAVQPDEVCNQAACAVAAAGLCMCGGAMADPISCGCSMTAEGCTCEGGVYPPATCTPVM
jgi:hypothetical protein